MTKKESTNKKNSLLIAKFLLDERTSKKNIINTLKISESTLYKHLSLIKKCGFKIIKSNDSYEILQYKNQLKLAKYELSIISYLLLMSYLILPKDKFTSFQKIINKILLITNKEDAKSIESKFDSFKLASFGECYSKKIDALKDHLNAAKAISITLKNSNELNIFPLEFEWIKNEINLKYKNENKTINSIPLNEIVKVKEIKKDSESQYTKETIFELHGRLAKSYLLKEEERIIDFTKDKIIIANYSKDKNKLFQRLLKYDILCKVTFPKTDVLKFKELIEKSLANIDRITDNI